MVDATHYHILDVSPSASQAEIKRSYRQLVKQFHPDSNRQVDSHDAIARINVAYEVLGDPQRRRTYDRQIGNIPSGRSPRSTPDRDRPGGSISAVRRRINISSIGSIRSISPSIASSAR